MISEQDKERIEREAWKIYPDHVSIETNPPQKHYREAYIAGATAENLRYEKVVEALDRLVNLKRYKDENSKDAYYEHIQPLAWAAATDALNQLNAPSPLKD